MTTTVNTETARLAGAPAGLVEVADVVEHVAPAYHGPTWDDVVTAMLNDPVEFDTIRALCQVLTAGGTFTEPIRVTCGCGYHADAGEYVDLDDSHPDLDALRQPHTAAKSTCQNLAVGNGMHRVVAALITGTTHLAVSGDYLEPAGDDLMVEFEWVLPADLVERYGVEDDDGWGVGFAVLRSFPTTAGWVDFDAMGSTGDSVSTYITWPLELAADLEAGLRTRAAAYGIELRNVTFSRVDD